MGKIRANRGRTQSITHLKDGENHKYGMETGNGNIKDKRRNEEINQALFLKFIVLCLRFSSRVMF